MARDFVRATDAATRRIRDDAKRYSALSRWYLPSTINVKAIRKRMGLSQADFARAFCFTIYQIRDWEQGRSTPQGGVRAYLLMLDHEPQAAMGLLIQLADLLNRADAKMLR